MKKPGKTANEIMTELQSNSPVSLSKDIVRLLVGEEIKKSMELEDSSLEEKYKDVLNKHDLIIHSKIMFEVWKRVETYAKNDDCILIKGENGTGRTAIATAIHNISHRSNKPFFIHNLPGIPPNLLVSELFGHEKGVFTGAASNRIGLFEQANESTIILSEIEELSQGLQVKLLSVLEENEIERVGGSKRIPIDVRVICVTNKNLKMMVEQGDFKKDLYYRLAGNTISIPPLNSRKEDIPYLAEFFFKKYYISEMIGGNIPNADVKILDNAFDELKKFDFRGNVRELQNFVYKLVLDYCYLRFGSENIGTMRADKTGSIKIIKPKSKNYAEDASPHGETYEPFENPYRIVTCSPIMIDLIKRVEAYAKTDISVLILGESGTGKELFATMIHKVSARAEMHYHKINCGSVDGKTVRSELFGHMKGMFTDGHKDHMGYFGVSDKGTLFLDEIGDVSQEFQSQLLRFLQHGEIQRIGENEVRKVDVRIIAATNKNLKQMINDEEFRPDFYSRIAKAVINVPPLRDRKMDIPLLAKYFFDKYSRKYFDDNHHRNFSVSLNSFKYLSKNNYEEGNVRELENFIEDCIALLNSPVELGDISDELKDFEEFKKNLIFETGDGKVVVGKTDIEIEITEGEVEIMAQYFSNGGFSGKVEIPGITDRGYKNRKIKDAIQKLILIKGDPDKAIDYVVKKRPELEYIKKNARKRFITAWERQVIALNKK